jgi:hypothetical protein
MIDLLKLTPEQMATRPRAADPYNTAGRPPASDVIEWDANTVEVVVLETAPDDRTND